MGGDGETTATARVGHRRMERARPQTDAARKRAAVELVARHEATLRRTARRYSLDEEDAEDVFQRALEIVLTKAPTTDPRELIRWTQTVTKHEALAVREDRERLLGRRLAAAGTGFDPVTLIPAAGDGPGEQTERRESIARSREALRALKPAELRALTLLAQGYSYAEIGEQTGFSQTKINRSLAEGRERFRQMTASSEDGTRCEQLRPLLSAFCDGEASAAEAETVREHLRACAGCRATLRSYRAAPQIAIALVPPLPLWRSLLGRLHDLLGGLGGGNSAPVQATATGGSGGLGMAGAAKMLGLCAVGGATCVAAGVAPGPLDLSAPHTVAPAIERSVAKPPDREAKEAVEATHPKAAPARPAHPEPRPEPVAEEATVETEEPSAEATEYEAPSPAPEPAPAPSPEPPSGSPAGEFGP